jgi:hypothetical protein
MHWLHFQTDSVKDGLDSLVHAGLLDERRAAGFLEALEREDVPTVGDWREMSVDVKLKRFTAGAIDTMNRLFTSSDIGLLRSAAGDARTQEVLLLVRRRPGKTIELLTRMDLPYASISRF